MTFQARWGRPLVQRLSGGGTPINRAQEQPPFAGGSSAGSPLHQRWSRLKRGLAQRTLLLQLSLFVGSQGESCCELLKQKLQS